MKNREDVIHYVVVTFGVLVISLWIAAAIINLFVHLVK